MLNNFNSSYIRGVSSLNIVECHTESKPHLQYKYIKYRENCLNQLCASFLDVYTISSHYTITLKGLVSGWQHLLMLLW